MALLLKHGLPDVSSILTDEHVDWTDDTAPAGHYLFPEGWRLFVDREPDELDFPCCVLSIPEDSKEKAAGLDCVWNVAVQVDFITQRDLEIDDLEAVLRRAVVMLTATLRADNGLTLITPQDRLSGPALHVMGGRAADNFEGTSTGKMESLNGHPQRRLYVQVACALRAAGNIVQNTAADLTLPAAAFTDAFDTFYFAQRTTGKTITLEAPTDGSRKVVTVWNYGAAPFTLAPQGMTGGLTIAALSGPTLLHWDASTASWATGL